MSLPINASISNDLIVAHVCKSGPRQREPLTHDRYHWAKPVQFDRQWAIRAAARPGLAQRFVELDIRPSSDWRKDAMAVDCLHPLAPIYAHWWDLLYNVILGREFDHG